MSEPRARRLASARFGAWGASLLFVAIGTLPSMWIALGSNSYSSAALADGRSDPRIFRAAAELARQGASPYSREVLAAHLGDPRALPFAYPPAALPILELHAIGSPRFGYVLSVVLFAFLQALAALSIGTLMLGLRSSGRQGVDRVAIALGVGISGATFLNATLGQTGTLLAAIALFMLAALQTRPRLAGLLLGSLIFKPHYLLFLGLVPIFERRWEVVRFAALGAGGLILLSLLRYEPRLWIDFIDAALQPNPSIEAMCTWIAWPQRFGLLAPEALHRAAFAGAALGLLGLVAALWATRRLESGAGESTHARIALALALATLTSPNTHPYDLTLWAIPLLVLPRAAPQAWLLGGGLFIGAALLGRERALLALGSALLVGAALLRLRLESARQARDPHGAPRSAP